MPVTPTAAHLACGDPRPAARDHSRPGAERRADTAALDSDRYDAVTIAAVADDEETLRLLLAMWAPVPA